MITFMSEGNADDVVAVVRPVGTCSGELSPSCVSDDTVSAVRTQ